jgi:acyl carrier protein
VGNRLKMQGLAAIRPDEGVEMLGALLAEPVSHAVVVRADWPLFIAGLASADSRFVVGVCTAGRGTIGRSAGHSESPTVPTTMLEELRALPFSERRKRLAAHVQTQVLTVLGLDPASSIGSQQGLRDFGIDSLMSVELRNRLQGSVGMALPSTLVFDYPTISALVDFLGRDVLQPERDELSALDALASERAQDERAQMIDELNALSPQEAEALLLEELEKTQNQIR